MILFTNQLSHWKLAFPLDTQRESGWIKRAETMEGETEEEIERRTYALDIHQQALCLPEDSLVFLRAKDISSENEGVERILRNCRWVGCANPSSSGCSQRILDLLRYRQGTILPSAWRSSRTSSPILVTVNNNEPSENIHWVPGIVHASLSQLHTVLKKMRPPCI